MKELATALAKAQGEIKAAVKESDNPAFKQGGKVTKYADLTSIWDACRSVLSKHGLSVIQRPDFNGEDVWLETMLMHSSGECITGRYPLRPQQHTPQGYGSALTYARRYSLASMVGVVADIDDDGNAASTRDDNAPAPQDKRNPNASLQKAKEWANTAIRQIGETKNERELDDWYSQWAAHLARLKASAPDDGNQVSAAVAEQRASFKPNVLAAG